MTIEIYGDFHEDEQVNCEEYLSIKFLPSRLSLKRRWENNGLSADFVAEYFKIFYVSQQEEENDGQVDEISVENLRNSIKYIANELLENAMKFQAPAPDLTTAHIFFSLYHDKLVFHISHHTISQHAESFKVFIRNLLANDPQTLYVEAMRTSVLEENTHRSGLGLLSMICDYNAKLGWKFENIANSPLVTVTTTVILETDC